MKLKINLLLYFFSLSFYGQNDTITVVKPSEIVIESVVDTTDIVYRGLDDLNSIYRLNDTISVVNDSNISFVSANKMNVVYRGLENLISITVPNSKSFKVSGSYLYKDAAGKYILLPGFGIESTIFLDIILNDGSTKKEKHKFRIKDIPGLYGKINELYCNHSIVLMTKKQITNSEISIGFPKDFAYELNFETKQFSVKINNKTVVIKGNKFTKKVLNLIDILPVNSIFIITDFKSNINLDKCPAKAIQNLKIMIVKDDYFDNEK